MVVVVVRFIIIRIWFLRLLSFLDIPFSGMDVISRSLTSLVRETDRGERKIESIRREERETL